MENFKGIDQEIYIYIYTEHLMHLISKYVMRNKFRKMINDATEKKSEKKEINSCRKAEKKAVFLAN
ncbi:MAG: hypothetical protein ACTSWN_04935, partial [Promethearchaeota archaeon]